MSDLFTTKNKVDEPLASRMRPRNLGEFIGQEQIIGTGKLLRRAIENDKLSSLIFYGSPGTGKTSLAKIIAGYSKSRFVILNAVLDGIKELKAELEEASTQKKLYDKKTILFVDEVHRWNKSQQDALLPWTENGTIVLVGATTENPFFEVNKALVSRSRIFNFTKINTFDMQKAIRLALSDKERGYGNYNIKIDEEAEDKLINSSGGDLRILYSTLELLIESYISVSSSTNTSNLIEISLQDVIEVSSQKAYLYDKTGNYHYDTISAFIKSVTGSDVDASLYWLAVLLESGEDVAFIWRRLLILASESVGLADPQAIVVVKNLCDSFHQIGMPEGYYFFSHATIYLATAPKSNSATCFFKALDYIKTNGVADVPAHLKDLSRGREQYEGDGYIYPHNHPNHYIAQSYLPVSLNNPTFYKPSNLGYEGSIASKIIERKILQSEINIERTVVKSSVAGEQIVREENFWLNYHDKFNSSFKAWRSDLFKQLANLRSDSKILFYGDDKAFLMLEAMKIYKEASFTSIVNNDSYDKLNGFFSTYQNGLAYQFIKLEDEVLKEIDLTDFDAIFYSTALKTRLDYNRLLDKLNNKTTLVMYGDDYDNSLDETLEKNSYQFFVKITNISNKRDLFYTVCSKKEKL